MIYKGALEVNEEILALLRLLELLTLFEVLDVDVHQNGVLVYLEVVTRSADVVQVLRLRGCEALLRLFDHVVQVVALRFRLVCTQNSAVLPREHHLFTRRLRGLVALLELLDAVGVPERVERVLAGLGGGRDVTDHDGLAISHKGVAEHQRELAAAEGRVGLVLVERADALFQREQTLVDLRAVDSC